MTQSWELSCYLVAYLDVLGQTEELLKLKRLPFSSQEKAEALSILRNTAGYVMSLRRFFQDYFEAASRPTGILDKLPRDQRETAKSMRRSEVEIRGVSDSIILVVPLANTNEHCTPMNGVYASLFAICGIFVCALASKRPFRGGIDIGLATRITKQEVYGPALVRAIKLESKIAEYPRVVVGDSMWSYLSEIETQKPNTPFGILAQKRAAESKTFITTDEYACRMLDVIGTSVKSFDNVIPPKLVEDGYIFVAESEGRYRESGDDKLCQRYGCLRRYLESRLNIWGIQPIRDSI